MRSGALATATTITILTDTTLDTDGRIVTTTVVASHGNATHTRTGRLHTDASGWWVTERGTDGVEHGTLFAESKKAALAEFARRATAKAAAWAVAP